MYDVYMVSDVYSCSGVQLTAKDLLSVAHFQSVALNLHLAHGDMIEAIDAGTVHIYSVNIAILSFLLHFI